MRQSGPVTSAIRNGLWKEREFGNFAAIRDNYPKLVISRDKIPLSENGIIHRNIIDFLLDR